MSVLDKICAKKREHVQAQKEALPFEEIKARIEGAEPPRGFIKALKDSPAPAVIAEVKKASPSKGIIRADFDPVEIAKIYEAHGASCISVLTDEPYFQGHDTYLTQIKTQATLPVLRKDFMVDAYQIYESRALGADCVLLIMAALGDEEAAEFYELAETLGMDVLIEVHDAAELERALVLNPVMIGVNNRNLKTLEVDLQTSHELAAQIPNYILKIAESGLSSAEDVQGLINTGYYGFLMGEHFMRQENIGAALQEIIKSS